MPVILALELPFIIYTLDIPILYLWQRHLKKVEQDDGVIMFSKMK